MNGNINFNTRKKGYYRDKEVKNAINTFQALTSEQICYLHFKDIRNWNHALIKTRERLRNIKGINKIKIDIYGKPYCYYIDKKPKDKNFLHIINRNWGLIYLINLNNYFKLDDIKHEYVLGNIQPDSFTRFYSEKGNKYSYWFIESDRSDSHNKFTKIKQYNEMYQNNMWANEYWNMDKIYKPDYFPKILIVSDTLRRIDTILECVRQENKEKLDFYIISVQEIKNNLINSFNVRQ